MIIFVKGMVAGHMRDRSYITPYFRAAARMSAERHKGQLRKDGRTPYVQHPVMVANILAHEAGITDQTTLLAALLHDTIEDTATSYAEIVERFGRDVADTVAAVTNDVTLPKADQKLAQVAHAAHFDERAANLKLADKIANLRDIIRIPPAGWTADKKQQYYRHAAEVVAAMKNASPALKAVFQYTFDKGMAELA